MKPHVRELLSMFVFLTILCYALILLVVRTCKFDADKAQGLQDTTYVFEGGKWKAQKIDPYDFDHK